MYRDEAGILANVGDHCFPVWGCSTVGQSEPMFAAANKVHKEGVAARTLTASVQCSAAPGYTCGPLNTMFPGPDFTLFSSAITLEDGFPPAFDQELTGDLVGSSEPLDGDAGLSFRASDRGSGVAGIGLVVDGAQRVAQQPVDASDTRCNAPHLTYAVPCAKERVGTVVFDTHVIPNGRHNLQIELTDRSGNATLSRPYPIDVRNGATPNGQGASRFVQLNSWIGPRRRRATTVGYSKRAIISGMLTDTEGRPIRGAALEVSRKIARPNSSWKIVGRAITSRRGRFRFRSPRGASHRLRFSYFAYSLDPAPTASAIVNVKVRAGVRLRVNRRQVSNGQRVVFHGKLRGKRGRAGTVTTIYALARHGRQRVPVEAVRANRHGRFKYRYRFRSTHRLTVYHFQAVVKRQTGYPYAAGKSRTVRLVVTP